MKKNSKIYITGLFITKYKLAEVPGVARGIFKIEL